MSLQDIGSDIADHENVNLVFPEEPSSFELSEESRFSTDSMLEIVEGVVFPFGKLMWPVVSFITPQDKVVYRRLKAVRSTKDSLYSINNIYLLCNDARGAWIFVRHERQTDDLQLIGFLTTLTNVRVKEYGNAYPVEIYEWLREYDKMRE